MAEPHDVELDEEPEAMIAVMLPLPPPHQVENNLAIPVFRGLRRDMYRTRVISILATLHHAYLTDASLMAAREAFPNIYHEDLERIYRKVKNGEYITPEEDQHWTTHSGFRFAHLGNRLRESQAQERSLTSSKGTELEPLESTGNETIEYQLHQDAAGPMMAEDLPGHFSLKQTMEGIVIGTSALFYLPFLDFRRLVNMGIIGRMSYRTMGLEGMRPIGHHQDYARLVWERLRIIGLESGLPVYLEFFLSSNRGAIHLHSHLLGFMFTIISLQQGYTGPIVMTIPPFTPLGQPITDVDYERKKRYQERVGRLATFYGHALGVPVFVIAVQNRRYENTSYYVRRHIFVNKFLFSKRGEMTEEFGKRMMLDFSYYQEAMRTGSLTRTEIRERVRQLP